MLGDRVPDPVPMKRRGSTSQAMISFYFKPLLDITFRIHSLLQFIGEDVVDAAVVFTSAIDLATSKHNTRTLYHLAIVYMFIKSMNVP